MKTYSWFVPAIFILAAPAGAQTSEPVSPEPVVVERGPHYRVWQRTTKEMLANGGVVTRRSGYTELAVGMHYLKDGLWTESKEEIELFQDGAIARQGQIHVIFAPNIATPGAIDLLMADGKRWRPHVLGIAVYDRATGKSEMVAEVKDSIGELHPPNVIIYPDAFSTDTGVSGAIRYTYSRDRLEQDIVLFNRLDLPQGFNSDTSQLEVWTEAVDFEEPEKIVLQTDGTTDQTLVFGAMRIIAGQAVPLNDPQGTTWSTPIYKQWVKAEGGRTFLVEACPYAAIKDQLDALPAPGQGAAIRKAHPARQMAALKPGQRPFPAAPTPARTGKIQLAALTSPSPLQRGMAEVRAAAVDSRPPTLNGYQQQTFSNPEPRGLVLDYSVVTTTNDVTFKGDTTYYVSGAATLSGTTTIEGGAVIKCTNANALNARLTIQGPVDCRASAYRPLILTGKDDNSVGEPITGSTGNPATNYYGKYIDLAGNTNAIDLHDIRIRHAYYAINMDSAVRLTLSHAQLGSNWAAVVNFSGGQAWLRNVLIHDGHDTFGSSGTNRAEHVTFHRLTNFRSSIYTNAWLTNCLIICVTNNVSYTGVGVVSNLNDSSFFQTVGSGAAYLAAGSTNRNSGTTNINPDLLIQLKQRTTYPPILLTNNITNDTVLTIQAQRDQDSPDLGYHYDPLDFVVSQIAVTNAALTLEPGTALGVYGPSNSSGLLLLDGSRIVSVGSPTNLNRIVRYNLVQEQANTNWSAASAGRLLSSPYPHATNLLPTELRFRFTYFSTPAAGDDHLFLGATNLTFSLRDCEFHGGGLNLWEPDVGLTNCLFDRVSATLSANHNPFNVQVRNCTFFRSLFIAENNLTGTWVITDNLIDHNFLGQDGSVTADYNAYVTNATRFLPAGAHDVLLAVTNVTYDSLAGRYFYLQTNSPLINHGSQNATNAGLYHFCTTTNQVK